MTWWVGLEVGGYLVIGIALNWLIWWVDDRDEPDALWQHIVTCLGWPLILVVGVIGCLLNAFKYLIEIKVPTRKVLGERRRAAAELRGRPSEVTPLGAKDETGSGLHQATRTALVEYILRNGISGCDAADTHGDGPAAHSKT